MTHDPHNPTEPAVPPVEPALNPVEAAKVDTRQDQLMKQESPDGRPPTHEARTHGSWWLLIAVSTLAVIGLVWSLASGASTLEIVGFGAAVVLVAVVGAWPVLTAGLLRGKEQAKARRESIAELQSGKLP